MAGSRSSCNSLIHPFTLTSGQARPRAIMHYTHCGSGKVRPKDKGRARSNALRPGSPRVDGL